MILTRATFLFAVFNFAGLAIGGLFTGPGVASEWYAELPQAPWTPPGWVFGAAWTVVMLGFSVFMGGAWAAETSEGARRGLVIRFAMTWLLNVAWNPVFFAWHSLTGGLAILLLLLAVLLQMGTNTKNGWWRWGLAPYLVWLCLATSLNLYPLL
jgi:tryptophan-rich sensory protein